MKMDNFDLDIQVTSMDSQNNIITTLTQRPTAPGCASWESEVSTCWHCEVM